MTATVSVIIPTYNQLSLARQAVQSVLNQQGVTIEVIVMDDSTHDDIQTYIQQLNDPRIVYWHNRPSLGAVKNWNEGLTRATGKYLLLLHHDEALQTNNHLAHLVQRMEQEHADIAVTHVQVFVNGRLKCRPVPKWLTRYTLHHPSILFAFNTIGPTACVLFRREQLQLFNTELRWLVDVEWYYRLLKGHKAIYDHLFIVNSTHQHKKQITQQINVQQAWKKDVDSLLLRYHGWTEQFMLKTGNTVRRTKQWI